MSVNNSGLTTNLSFTVTTDKNGTQVRYNDTPEIDGSLMTCTIMISHMSLTVLYMTNMFYHYKVLQVMFLLPTRLGFTALTNTSVTLYWSPPTLYPNCIVNYTVEIRTTSDNILISSLSTGSNITSINVSTGLSQSVEYQYRVVGSDAVK